MNEDNSKYMDMLDMPHHVSSRHPAMSIHDRAAQFAPFAALTGHGAAIAEKARLTEEKLELADDRRDELDAALQSAVRRRAPVRIEYFVPDDRKAGGSYVTAYGIIESVDEQGRRIVMENGEIIPADDIYDIGDCHDK